MSELKAIFVDDDRGTDEINRIREILQDAGVQCEVKDPPSFDEIPSLSCHVFITDFNLAKKTIKGGSFSGNTLSTEYRNQHPNTPIVLLTQEGLVIKNKNIRTDNTDLDLIWYKTEAVEDEARFVAEIKSLAYGFEALVSESKRWKAPSDGSERWNSIRRLMQTDNDEEFHLLRESNPPIHPKTWNVPEITEWIRGVVLEYPGILLDYKYAAVRLGIDPDVFLNDVELQTMFKSAKYTGIYKEFGDHWWRNRLIQIAKGFLLGDGIYGLLQEDFVATYNTRFQTTIQPAACNWDKTPIAETICYVTGEPVKLKNSLLYNPDNRPLVMDRARISRQVLMKPEIYDEFLIDPDSKDLADEWIKEIEDKL